MLSQFADTLIIRNMKASVFIATSLDGFIARPDGALDWLPSDGESHGYDEFIATIDAIVMGRNTFDTVLSFDAWPLGATPVFVLTTRSLTGAIPAGAVYEAVTGAPRAIVAQLATRGHAHLYIDGGITVQQFLEAGLIQRVIITRVPVVLGAGIPLFGPVSRDIRAEHVVTRTFANGLVQSEYHLAS